MRERANFAKFYEFPEIRSQTINCQLIIYTMHLFCTNSCLRVWLRLSCVHMLTINYYFNICLGVWATFFTRRHLLIKRAQNLEAKAVPWRMSNAWNEEAIRIIFLQTNFWFLSHSMSTQYKSEKKFSCRKVLF